MAIDFMVMPLSRYVAGDFVTPVMRAMWELGTPYSIIGPAGPRILPPGIPFGGQDAGERRQRFVPEIQKDLRAAPFELWDEASDAVPRIHRVDTRSFHALLEHVERLLPSKPSLWGRLTGKSRDGDVGFAHLLGTLFVPRELHTPIRIETPIHAILTSVPRALKQLAAPVPAEAEAARETMLEALRDASELGLPMIIDA